MHQRISKTIFIYFFIFLILGTLNNKNFLEFNFFSNNNLRITDESENKDIKIYSDLSKFKNQNLFFLNKDKVASEIKKHQIVENYFVFKHYPNNLSFKIQKTKLLAIVKKNGFDFYIGSNGNLIKIENDKIDLPYIFGKTEISEFLKLKDIIDSSEFDYSKIEKFYYFKSKRWDIKTKDGQLVRLPKQRLEKSFKILTNILNSQEFKDLKEIDLRQENQVILNG